MTSTQRIFMSKDLQTDSLTAIRTLTHAVSRSEISLIALNHITSEHSLEYFKDLDKEDIPHNLDALFEELRSIYELLREENEGLREYKRDLEAEVARCTTK